MKLEGSSLHKLRDLILESLNYLIGMSGPREGLSQSYVLMLYLSHPEAQHCKLLQLGFRV